MPKRKKRVSRVPSQKYKKKRVSRVPWRIRGRIGVMPKRKMFPR